MRREKMSAYIRRLKAHYAQYHVHEVAQDLHLLCGVLSQHVVMPYHSGLLCYDIMSYYCMLL